MPPSDGSSDGGIPGYGNSGDNKGEDADDTIEAARFRLESLMRGHESDEGDDDVLSSSLSTAVILSSEMKEVRRTEMKLLAKLETSDDALSDLWALWFSERGPGPATELLNIESMVTDGSSRDQWDEAEERLNRLIQKYNSNGSDMQWAEPVNRLATLCYLQGRFLESKKLCLEVLSIKPWHVGALAGVVLVCAKLGDGVNAKIWSSRRLPPLHPQTETATADANERRKEWVHSAVREAGLTLLQSSRQEKSRQKKEQQKSSKDDGYRDGVVMDNDGDRDVWQ